MKIHNLSIVFFMMITLFLSSSFASVQNFVIGSVAGSGNWLPYPADPTGLFLVCVNKDGSTDFAPITPQTIDKPIAYDGQFTSYSIKDAKCNDPSQKPKLVGLYVDSEKYPGCRFEVSIGYNSGNNEGTDYDCLGTRYSISFDSASQTLKIGLGIASN